MSELAQQGWLCRVVQTGLRRNELRLSVNVPSSHHSTVLHGPVHAGSTFPCLKHVKNDLRNSHCQLSNLGRRRRRGRLKTVGNVFRAEENSSAQTCIQKCRNIRGLGCVNQACARARVTYFPAYLYRATRVPLKTGRIKVQQSR